MKKRFWWAVVATLVLVGVLVGGGFSAFRAGWRQGYAVGQLPAEEADAEALVPYAYPGFAIRYPLGLPFMIGPLGIGLRVLLGVGLFVLLLMVIGRLVFGLVWLLSGAPVHAGWSPHQVRWSRRHYWHHGMVPPWYQGPEGPTGEAPGVNKETGASEA